LTFPFAELAQILNPQENITAEYAQLGIVGHTIDSTAFGLLHTLLPLMLPVRLIKRRRIPLASSVRVTLHPNFKRHNGWIQHKD
jgi:hypothetical protein